MKASARPSAAKMMPIFSIVLIGEHAFEVALHQRIEHAHHRGDAADASTDHAPPPVRRSQQVEHDAHEAVDRDLGHHAAHQRGDMAGRGRVGERQPGMQRHEAGLRAGADQHEDQHQRRQPGGWHARRGWRRRRSCRRAGEQAEGEQQSQRAEARHQQIDVAGAHIVAVAMMRDHQRPGGERHELPRHQEAEGIVGQHHEIHGGEITPDRTAARAAALASWRP